jgi:ribosomal protein S12 methylthiotransferase accessory factor
MNTASKRFFDGTHRSIPPEETLERVRPLLRVMGITRVADVTGLDEIGIPVVSVCRPNARSLSVAQGKGHSLAAAMASGIMESIEAHHAEHIDLPLKLATWNELRFTHRLVNVSALPRLSIGQFHPNLRTLWIEGRNLFDGGSTWVPFEIVHLDYTIPLPTGSGSFVMSSNGLASGNHLLEAVSHGLCELIERDATTLSRLAPEAARREARVDLGSVDDPGCRDLLDQCERAGLLVEVREITSDIGVPAFSCTIVDRDPNPQRPVAPTSGIGCHPSRAVALSRAVTEAVQTRLTLITGARDDMQHLRAKGPAEELASARRARDEMIVEPPSRSFRDAPDFHGQTFEADVGWLLERLRAAGIREAVAVDLTKPIFKIPVARVIAPGLEALNEVPGYVPGARARRRLEERGS